MQHDIHITGLRAVCIYNSLYALTPPNNSKTRNSSTNLAVQLWFSMKMATLQSGGDAGAGLPKLGLQNFVFRAPES